MWENTANLSYKNENPSERTVTETDKICIQIKLHL